MKKSKFRRVMTVFLVILGVLAVLFGCLSPLLFQRDERLSASAAGTAYTVSFQVDSGVSSISVTDVNSDVVTFSASNDWTSTVYAVSGASMIFTVTVIGSYQFDSVSLLSGGGYIASTTSNPFRYTFGGNSSFKITTSPRFVISKGYYLFNSSLSLPDNEMSQAFSFTSGNQHFGIMQVQSSGLYYNTAQGSTLAYSSESGWQSSPYGSFSIINVALDVTTNYDFYTWFNSQVTLVPSDYADLIDQAYSQGYDVGYSNGLQSGNQQLFDKGYESGYQAGYTDGTGVSYSNLNVVSLFLSPVNSFLATPLFGSFSFGTAFSVVLVVLLGAIFIKMFAGG